MFKTIYKLLDVESGEERMVTLLIIQSFFLGVYNITLSVSAESLFLQTFDEVMIGRAYMLSGVAGILLTAIYSKLQSVLNFSRLSAINLLSMAAISIGMWYGFTVSANQWLIFALFVMMGPLLLIPIINFTGMVLRLFTLRQGKRLFGLVDSGLVFGIIIFGLITPIVIQLLDGAKNLLLVSTVSMLLALVVQLIISKLYDINQDSKSAKNEEELEKESEVNTTKLLFKDSYVRTMALFTAVTMVALFFVQYSFLSVTKAKYPEETDLAGFLGSFTAAMMILSFLIKTFVYSKLVKTYGLKVSFLILPVLTAIFIFGAIVSGHVFGYDATESSFVFFFLLICISRLFSVALKEAIQNPSFRILYQSLGRSIRFGVQAKIDGVVNEVAASLAGSILAGLGLLAFFELIHYSYALLIILGVWTWLAGKLYMEYKGSLEKSLSSLDEEDLNLSAAKSTFMLNERYNNGEIKNFDLYKKFHETNLPSNNQFELLSPQELKKVARSKDTLMKRELTNFLLHTSRDIEELHPTISELLRDTDDEVRNTILKVIAQHKVSDLYHQLIDHLNTTIYEYAAYQSIKEVGTDIINEFEHNFSKTGIEEHTRVLLAKIAGEIGSEEAIKWLVGKINHPEFSVQKQVFESLHICEYQGNEDIINKIIQEIEVVIGITTWNINITNTLSKDSSIDIKLIEALNLQINRNYDLIFILLSLCYDSKSIEHIKENIEGGTSEGIGFAIELLDLFVNDELKPKLFPLLEDITTEQRLTQLQDFYPVEERDMRTCLIDLINRDYNQLSKWAKCCAILALKNHISKDDIPTTLVACLFNSDKVIQETSAIILNSINTSLYESTSKRIGLKNKLKLDFHLQDINAGSLLPLMEIGFQLQNTEHFNELDGEVIFDLITEFNQIKAEKDSQLKEQESNIFIVLSTSATLLADNQEKTFYKGSVICDDHYSTLTAISAIHFLKIPVSIIFGQISKHPILLDLLVTIITNQNVLIAPNEE